LVAGKNSVFGDHVSTMASLHGGKKVSVMERIFATVSKGGVIARCQAASSSLQRACSSPWSAAASV